ncbi:MAG TPA: hypothetical protein VG204_10685 [Terriglobia bacterium]|nr:hypothetical protein [Terriglobia bacterium]
MINAVVGDVLQYGDYLLEVVLVAVVVYRGLWRRLPGVSLYLLSLVALDTIGRPLVLYRFGFHSTEYWYTYWITNVALQLAAFLLVCYFFRSACANEERLWHVLRLALPLVFLLTVALSVVPIWQGRLSKMNMDFVAQFEQYMYFACLVLNTLLFIMMQYVEVADGRLPLLVCGLGLQFAGPAAGMAVVVLTGAQGFAKSLVSHIDPLCTLGMLLAWLYAVTRVPRTAPRPVRQAPRAVEQAA